jgi:lipoprotein Spr
LRNRNSWCAAAAFFVLLALPTTALGDEPTSSSPSDPPREIVVSLGTNPSSDSTPAPQLPKTDGILAAACDLSTSLLGCPYRWGGTTPEAFDCSGFVRYIYSELGVKLPRTARQQFKVGVKVTGAALRAGDLVFFDMMKGYVSHVGMYLGGGKFIHASTPRTGVRIDPLKKYAKHIVGARRYVS